MNDYLIKRGDTYYFSRRVPSKLVSIIEKTQWRETLKTSDPSTARKLAVQHLADSEQAIAVATLEYRRQRSTVARLTKDEREVLEAAGGLKALRRQTVGSGPNASAISDMGLRGEVRLAEAVSGMTASLAREARVALAADGLDLDDIQEQLSQDEARASAVRTKMERNLAILRKDTEEAADAELASDTSGQQGTAATLQTILDRWARESGAPEQHVEQYGYAVRRFHELHGQVALADVTRANLREYKDAIVRLPRSTRADLRRAPLDRAVAIADWENLPRIEEKTARKHVIALSTLLGHAVSWGYIDKSPADGLRFLRQRQKKGVGNEPKGFTPAQLTTLDASLAAEHKDTDDDRWIPIVAAYQGCRQEEVCQLLKTDIRQHKSGIWVMSITDAGDDQKVKNRPSVRTIPIHAALVERGFLSHLERSPGPLVFASLKPDARGRLGGPYGKRFARHLKLRTKIIGLSFHDTRHAWKTAARNADIPTAIQRAIMGHRQEDGVPEDYGEKQGPAVLKKYLDRVDPFGGPSA